MGEPDLEDLEYLNALDEVLGLHLDATLIPNARPAISIDPDDASEFEMSLSSKSNQTHLFHGAGNLKNAHNLPQRTVKVSDGSFSSPPYKAQAIQRDGEIFSSSSEEDYDEILDIDDSNLSADDKKGIKNVQLLNSSVIDASNDAKEIMVTQYFKGDADSKMSDSPAPIREPNHPDEHVDKNMLSTRKLLDNKFSSDSELAFDRSRCSNVSQGTVSSEKSSRMELFDAVESNERIRATVEENSTWEDSKGTVEEEDLDPLNPAEHSFESVKIIDANISQNNTVSTNSNLATSFDSEKNKEPSKNESLFNGGLTRRRTLLEDVLYDVDDAEFDKNIDINLTEAMKHRLLKQILNGAETIEDVDFEEMADLPTDLRVRHSISNASLGEKLLSPPLSEKPFNLSRNPSKSLHIPDLSLTMRVDNLLKPVTHSSKAAEILSKSPQDSETKRREMLQNMGSRRIQSTKSSSSTPSRRGYFSFGRKSKTPKSHSSTETNDQKAAKPKEKGIAAFANAARERIRKLGVQTGLGRGNNVLLSSEKKNDSSHASLFDDSTPNDFDVRRSIVRNMMREAAKQPKKKVDARFEPNKKNAPSVISKVPISRIMHWEQMLAGIYEIDDKVKEKSKQRVGRLVRQLSDGRKLLISDVVSKAKTKRNSVVMPFERKRNPKPKAVCESNVLVDTLMLEKIGEKLESAKGRNDVVAEEGSFERIFKSSNQDETKDSATTNSIKEMPIEKIIDLILENNAEMKSVVMDDHLFFHGLSLHDINRSLLTKLLVEALALNNHIETFSAVHCALDDSFVEVLCEYIEKGGLSQLKSLNLMSNLLSERGISLLGNALASKSGCALVELNLKNQGLPISKSAIISLCFGIRENFTLVNLEYDNLQTSESDDSPDDQISDAIRVIQRSLRRNRELAEGKKSASKKITLFSIEEKIKSVINCDEECYDLTIHDDRIFERLPLSFKLELAKSLKDNSFLKVLKLSNVKLEDNFLSELAESLAENCCLEQLNLEGNMLSENGILILVEALSKNSSLKQVNVLNQEPPIKMTTELESLLFESLQQNNHLNKFELEFQDPLIQAQIKAWIQRNCLNLLSNWS